MFEYVSFKTHKMCKTSDEHFPKVLKLFVLTSKTIEMVTSSFKVVSTQHHNLKQCLQCRKVFPTICLKQVVLLKCFISKKTILVRKN